jgi:microcin C transport system substrate-binding protein
MARRLAAGIGLTILALLSAPGAGPRAEPAGAHAIAMLASPKYGPGFAHFDYVNPDAPKGGTLTLAAIGSYDSLNPFILKGTPAAGVDLAFETLMVSSQDEPFTKYGLLAEAIRVADDGGSVEFDLRPEARFHDGRPVTPEDVVFSFETLTTKGHPRYKAYWANVTKAERTAERTVRFTFDGEVNRELPLIVGEMPVLPKHHYEKLDFERTSLELPLGSGPYKIARFDAGRSIALERVRDHWAANLAVNRGRHNYDQVRYEYYRDSDVALEAFKAGQFDLRFENSAKRWATGYVGPAVERGLIKVKKLDIPPPARMQGYVFNTRRPLFQDRRVREALGYAFDFEWSNKTLFYGQYERITSYFHGEPDLASKGLPGPDELALLEPFRDRLPPEVFSKEFRPPQTDGSGNIRDGLRQALRLLREAGWEVKEGVLTHAATGQRMEFEILLDSPEQERVAGPFAQNLVRLGARARLRTVDPAQYQVRMDAFDFDVTTDVWGQSDSPGNEQRDFWGSAVADSPGSRNTIGVKDPVVDALVDRLIRAPDRGALETACKALDRVLLWGHYLVPHFTDNGYKVAWWDKLAMPEVLPTEGPDVYAWWIDPAKDAAVSGRKPEVTGAAAKP